MIPIENSTNIKIPPRKVETEEEKIIWTSNRTALESLSRHCDTVSMFHNGKSNKGYKSTLLPKGIVTNACLKFRVSKRNVKLNL